MARAEHKSTHRIRLAAAAAAALLALTTAAAQIAGDEAAPSPQTPTSSEDRALGVPRNAPGAPDAGAIDMVLVPRAVMIDDADPGEVYVGVNPTDGTATIDVQVNGVSVGSIEITTGGVVTWNLAAPVVLAAGDRLALVAPTPADSTLADVLVALRGAAT